MPLMSFEDDEASYVARIAQVRSREFPEAEPRALCRAGTSRQPNQRAILLAGETSGRGNHNGGESNARQNQTTSVSPKKAKPRRGREARQTAGRGAGAA